MRNDTTFDKALVQRFPLPLAQLCRRAHNAKTALKRHLTAFYLWEPALKLLGAVAIVSYAQGKSPEPQLAERLKNLARPALGHWWEFVRLRSSGSGKQNSTPRPAGSKSSSSSA
jgi:hypothetical protein